MPTSPDTFRPFGGSRADDKRAYNRSRYGNDTRKLYDRRWRNARAKFLLQHPLCVMCEAKGLTFAAEVVDHKRPHRGDLTLFWDQGNWQALCKPCHDSEKQRQERAGLR